MRREWIVLIGCCGAIGCGSSLPHPRYEPQATTALSAVDTSPPPGRIERIPKRPVGADAWIDGEWIRQHGRWYWLLGRWVKVPPGARYSPWVSVRSADGAVFFAPSVWVDAKHSAIPEPPPLALATANGEAVYDPEGQVQPTGRNLSTAPPKGHRNEAAP
jgi:hypothetical protein